MDELISRQAAIDAVLRAEALVRVYGYRYAADAVRELPPAQPEIIRCRDCKYYNPDPADHCYLQGAEADDFCSYAERREE